MPSQIDPINNSDDLNFLMDHVELVDEEIKQWISENPNKDQALLEDNSLNSKKYKQITYEDLTQRQKLLHEKEEHALRKEHLNFLSKITIYWLALITVISIFQGFGSLLPFEIKLMAIKKEELPFILIYKDFRLPDSSYIALITTTTATILGLYTIAAIWLYKGKQDDKKQKNDKQNSSEDPE